MNRIVVPELLDELPPTNASAIGSRRDLRRLNRLMGHDRALARVLSRIPLHDTSSRILELGAGDGTFLLKVAERLQTQGKAPPAEVILIDQQNLLEPDTVARFQRLNWKVRIERADVFQFLREEREVADVIIANLFLHHFKDRELKELLDLIRARTRFFAALEPRRAALPLFLSHLTGCLGCNSVTRHDAAISVRAGFSGNELSRLWSGNTNWHVRENAAGICTHAFFAELRSPRIG